jgi:hypothetical protein
MEPFDQIATSILFKFEAGEYPEKEIKALAAVMLYNPELSKKIAQVLSRIEAELVKKLMFADQGCSLSRRSQTEISFLNNLTEIATCPIEIEPEKIKEIKGMLTKKQPGSVEELGRLTNLPMSEVFLALVALRAQLY